MSNARSDKILNDELIYGINDNPVFVKKLIVTFEHLCSIIVPIMIPGYIICTTLKMDNITKSHIICMGLLFSGIGTIIHAKKIKIFGSGLLSVQGVNFIFVMVFISIGKIGGLPLIFGMAFIGSFLGYFLAPVVYKLKRLIPPVVSGTVVVVVGLSLMNVALKSFTAGVDGSSLPIHDIQVNILIGLFVIGLIVFFQCMRNSVLKSGAIIWGIIGGFILSIILGRVDYSAVYISKSAIFTFPHFLKYGFSFKLDLVPVVLVAYFISYMEEIGDFAATSLLSDGIIEGEEYNKRVRGGILGDTVTCTIGTLFGSLPTTVFAQNNGIIQLTGVASRKIALWIGIVLILLGLFPSFSILFILIPQPVIGGAMIMIFGIIAVVGLKIISSDQLRKREIIILALSLGVSLEFANPEYFAGLGLPETIKILLSSPICMGGITSFFLNLVLPQKM